MAPTTRRSAGRGGGKQQTTLSFNHRVTKPSSAAKSAKDRASLSPATPAKTKEEEKEEEKDEEKSEVELRALALSEKDIRWHLRLLKYGRVGCHVHHEGLAEAERILRVWDVSSQYGVRCFHYHDLLLCFFFAPQPPSSPAS